MKAILNLLENTLYNSKVKSLRPPSQISLTPSASQEPEIFWGSGRRQGIGRPGEHGIAARVPVLPKAFHNFNLWERHRHSKDHSYEAMRFIWKWPTPKSMGWSFFPYENSYYEAIAVFSLCWDTAKYVSLPLLANASCTVKESMMFQKSIKLLSFRKCDPTFEPRGLPKQKNVLGPWSLACSSGICLNRGCGQQPSKDRKPWEKHKSSPGPKLRFTGLVEHLLGFIGILLLSSKYGAAQFPFHLLAPRWDHNSPTNGWISCSSL